MSLNLVITNAGRAALVNAAHDGTNAVRIAGAGLSATAVVPSAAATSLPGEIKRVGTLSGAAIAADVIHLVVRDESASVYSLRSFALYLADGTLFAIYGQADPILEKSASAMLLLAIDATLTDVSAAQISFGDTQFLNPPATYDRAGVMKLATLIDAKGGAPDSVVTPAIAIAALLDWLGYTPVNRAGDTMTGRLTFAHATGNWSVGLPVGADRFIMRDEQFGTDVLTLDPSGNIVIGSYDRVGERRLALANRVTAFEIVTSGTPGGGTRILNSWVTGGQGPLVLESSGGEMARFSSAGQLQLKQSPTRAGNLMWDAGNDGAGSGLDADLLDGRDGGWYADVVGRLGFIPVRQTAGFVVEIRFEDRRLKARVNLDTELGAFAFLNDIADVWRSSNDGAGSGLDADLLDGYDGAWYSDIVGRLGFMPVRQTAGFVVEIRYEGGRLKARVNLDTELGAFAFMNDIADVWRLSNDGAGSGLDADLLDGYEAAAFMLRAGGRFSGPISLKSIAFEGTAGNYSLSIADGSDKVTLRDNQFAEDILSLSRGGLTMAAGKPVKAASGGRYVHYKDDLPGDTITRSTAAPAGGSDGDTHYEVNVAAGTMRLWHNYGGTWVHT